jgi:hypothetical protein
LILKVARLAKVIKRFSRLNFFGYLISSNLKLIKTRLNWINHNEKNYTSFNTYTFSSIVKLGNAIYPVGEYPYLKEFFSKVILVEKSYTTFRKR